MFFLNKTTLEKTESDNKKNVNALIINSGVSKMR